MVIFYGVLAMVWCILGVISGDTADFACSIGCLILMEIYVNREVKGGNVQGR